MKRYLALFFLLICLAPALVAGGKSKPNQNAPRQYTIEQLIKTARVTAPSFSADESKVLYSSNVSGLFNVWTVPSHGGTPQPITHSTTESLFAVSYFPADDRILYSHDRGGGENSHPFLRALGCAHKDLSPRRQNKRRVVGW